MKIWKKTAALLAVLLLAAALPLSAGAEGFAFNWDVDDNTAPNSESLLLYNLDTDTVVYSLEADKERPMASMTKIMAYIVAYETIPDIENVVITMPQSVEDELRETGSSIADMYPGEAFTGLNLLYMMMVPSGNNAALTLAKYVDSLYESGQLPRETPPAPAEGEESGEGASSEEGEETPQGFVPDPNAEFDPTDYTGSSYFVYLMNKKAEELGCTHTHFTNPHGLHNAAHYTTAREMVTITKYAMALPNFTEITGTTGWNYSPVGSTEVRTAGTTNKLLQNYVDENTGLTYYYRYCTGIKTGSLDESGYCITASATAYGYTYIAVAMGSPMYYEDGSDNYVHGEMLDCASLFRWALSNLEKKTIAVQGDVLSSVSLKYAWNQDTLQLVAGDNVAVMLPASVDVSSILITPNVPESVEATVRKGEQIGTATLSYAGESLATVPLVAAESVERSEAIHVWEQGRSLVSSPWFLAVMGIIAALVVIYIILILLYRRKQRQLRKVRRFRNM